MTRFVGRQTMLTVVLRGTSVDGSRGRTGVEGVRERGGGEGSGRCTTKVERS